MKNLTISGQCFQRFYCLKKDIDSCAVFSSTSTAQLQISFVEISLRHPLEISLIENEIYCNFEYSAGFQYT